jgi:aminoglycoside phosphotransferase (APT) family kinase protein
MTASAPGPAVHLATCLVDLGLGAPVGDGSAPAGRNHNWAGSTARGRRVFVKQLRGSRGDARRRLRRTLAFEQAIGSAAVPSPRLLGICEKHLVLVTELVEDATSGAELADAGEFGPALAAEAGHLVARLHSAPAGTAPDTSRPPLPDPALLSALPLATYLRSSNAELAFWRLVQSDPAIAGSVTRLLSGSDRAPHVAAHCDLRLDQLLRSGGRLLLTDGEEFRRADPARDVGSFAGEWLFRAVNGLATDTPAGDRETTEAQIIRTASRRLAERRPIVASFWAAYAGTRRPDPGLAVRATAFAGWHLLDRAVAGAARSARLAAPLRAAMGVGRQALATPDRFAATIGLA